MEREENRTPVWVHRLADFWAALVLSGLGLVIVALCVFAVLRLWKWGVS